MKLSGLEDEGLMVSEMLCPTFEKKMFNSSAMIVLLVVEVIYNDGFNFRICFGFVYFILFGVIYICAF
jgi:hypothetical protein